MHFTKKHILIGACFLVLLFSSNVFALVPPLSEDELDANSTLIVEGVVVNNKKYERSYKDHCYKWQKYVADFEVSKTHKGTAAKTIKIYYQNRVSDIVNPPCVGGDTSYWLPIGASYKLYLEPSAQSENGYYFVNWAGVIRLETK